MTGTEYRRMADGVDGSSPRSLRTVDDLRTGDNACFIYSSEQEYQTVMASFVRTGLEQRQRLIYIHDMRSPESVRSMLREAGVDIDHAEFREQILFVPAKQIYARGAGYSSDRVLDQLHAMTALALADGWSALRVTSEMTWVLRQTQGTERLLAHEGRMVGFYRDSAALGLGQFDRGKFPAEALLDVLLAHPVAMLGTEDRVRTDIYYDGRYWPYDPQWYVGLNLGWYGPYAPVHGERGYAYRGYGRGRR